MGFFNRKNNKYLAYIMCVNIFLIILYKVIGYIATKQHLLFRGWINVLYVVNIFILIILGTAFIHIYIWFSFDSKVLKILSTGITGVVIFLCYLFGSLMYAFTYSPEHVIYKYNHKMIAKVASTLWDTTIYFYEPVNMFFMKESDFPPETYDGSYDKYKNRK